MGFLVELTMQGVRFFPIGIGVGNPACEERLPYTVVSFLCVIQKIPPSPSAIETATDQDHHDKGDLKR